MRSSLQKLLLVGSSLLLLLPAVHAQSTGSVAPKPTDAPEPAPATDTPAATTNAPAPAAGPTTPVSAGSSLNTDDEIIRFNFRFGFFDDELTPLTEVIKDDVEGVICQTQYFLSHLIQNATNTKSVHAKATEIDWGYYQKQDLPAQINFTVEFEDGGAEGDVNWVDDQILITEMEALGQAGLQRFITEYVWKAEPQGLNFFLNANRMAFDGVKRMRMEGTMDEAECPTTAAPTMMPTVSPAPTMDETLVAPSVAAATANYSDSIPVNALPNLVPNVTSPPGGAGGAGGTSPPGGAGNPNSPAGSGDSGPIKPNPNNARPDWPFGPNYESLDDLKPMNSFSLGFAMTENHEQPPSKADVSALMCKINEFFTQELRKKLKKATIYSKAVYIDWMFDESGTGSEKEDIEVNFTSFTYYGDAQHTQVDSEDVFQAMKLTPAELNSLVENFVWKSEPENQNLFSHTKQVFLDAVANTRPSDKAMLVEADGCIFPETEPTPFTPLGAGGPGGADGTGAGNGGSGTLPPDENGVPNMGLGGDAKGSQVRVAFRVSNLEGIKDPTAVKAEGLDASFPVFASEMVQEIAKRDAKTRRLQVNGRRLRVVAVPGSAEVDSVQEYPCPSNALPDLTCHSASAKYDVLMTSDEDQAKVQNQYTDATQTAVDDGTYNNILQRVDPETPLFIGIMTNKDQIPPGSQNHGDDDGWFKWWYILLLLLLFLCCCLIFLWCMTSRRDRGDYEPKTTVVEEREVLVEEFEDEVPDDHHGSPEDEEFVDDPNGPGGGVMVPYQDPKAPAPAPTPAPYDPDEKARQDQAERERILNNSQRGEEQWEEDRKDK